MRCAAERGAVVLAVALSIAACKDDAANGDDAGGTEGDADSGDADSGDAATGGETAGMGESGDGSTGEPGAWASLEERPCPDDSFLTFENFGAIHLLNYCTGCHSSGLPADQRQGAPIEINFDDIEDVRAHASRIWARAGDGNVTMPPAGGAPQDERALLGEWLACGAPMDADTPAD